MRPQSTSPREPGSPALPQAFEPGWVLALIGFVVVTLAVGGVTL
jgi:hypothetical protein